MYEILSKLYDRATGGSEVAAGPARSLDDFFPQGSSPAGIDAAIDWFKENQSRSTQSFLFLVGGPGGGKSHVSNRLVEGLTEINPKSSELAHRSHVYATPAREVLLINDATIKEDSSEEAPLAAEISECIALDRALIACINRGILVEELDKATKSQSWEVVAWLSGQPTSEGSSIELGTESDYLKTARLKLADREPVDLCVVFVDTCSLFEQLPSTSTMLSDSKVAISAEKYTLTRLPLRRSIPSASIPGIDLISRCAKTLQDAIGDIALEFDPFQANLSFLTDESLAAGLGNILRSAEVTSGQRFSYREVWGLLARAIIGDMPLTVQRADIDGFVASMQPSGESALADFNSLQKLASYRISQSIFGLDVKSLTSTRSFSIDPVVSLTSTVDPILDGQPGVFVEDDASSGWTNPLIDGFAGSFGATSPLDAILTLVSGNEGDLFAKAITKFDLQLDSAFVELMQIENLKSEIRESAITWYSTYVSRLYALANGIPAFREQTSIWLDLWRSSPTIPPIVQKQLLTMLRPPKNPADSSPSSLIPLYDSRTLPFVGFTHNSKLGIHVNDMKIRSKKTGDAIFIEVEEHSKVVAEILIDFALLRDALACIPNYVGVTELSAATAPRLERLRASRLVPFLFDSSAEISVVSGTDEKPVIVREV
jgi:hypothetical protein